MPSRFVHHFTNPLFVSRPSSPSPSLPVNPEGIVCSSDTVSKQALRSLLIALNQPFSHHTIDGVLRSLLEIGSTAPSTLDVSPSTTSDEEEEALKTAIVAKLVVGIYAKALDNHMSQAMEVEAEAEWWAEIERSCWNVAWYLLSTTPLRIMNLAHTIMHALQIQNLPFSLSILTPSSLRRLFPSTSSFRPTALTTSLFPHLRHQSFSRSSSALLFPASPSSAEMLHPDRSALSRYLQLILSLVTLPLVLTRQECRFKRKELDKLRDERAEVLGNLAQLRGTLASVVQKRADLVSFIVALDHVVTGQPASGFNQKDVSGSLNQSLIYLNGAVIPRQVVAHQEYLMSQNLMRPSRLTLFWPKLVLLPPLTLYALRSLYASRASLVDVARDARQTIEGFLKGWLIEPLKEVLKTVRAGGENGVIIRKEGVAADFDSLERMTISLAKDELHYGPEQLAALSKQIKLGDLTPILQLYEEDIRRPLKSVLTGTLLRSVFIQIQKAKVDIDQALAGIDKLLKSQELTFAFVGVAPAIAIVYLLGGSIARVFRVGRGGGRYGGKYKRASVWSAMRRIERLLISRPLHSSTPSSQVQNPSLPNTFSSLPLSPLTTGLLLLSVAHLRTYAETCLPTGSRLREGFLEDVADLEDPELGRDEKMKVVERMWRCWGQILGWSTVDERGVGT